LIFSIIEFESAKLQNNYELRGMNEEKLCQRCWGSLWQRVWGCCFQTSRMCL